MDNLDFLDGPEGPKDEVRAVETVVEAPAETPAAEAEPVAEAPKGPERGPDGKFVAKEKAEPAAAEPVEQPKPAVPEGYVPVKALQELREELKALKQAPPAAPQPPAPVPDVFEDPEGYAAYQQHALLNHSLNVSERFAVKEYGLVGLKLAPIAPSRPLSRG